jgi:hypothetical protein
MLGCVDLGQVDVDGQGAAVAEDGALEAIFHAGQLLVPVCVQRRLTCSASDRLAGVKARSPVARIAGWRETEILKPIDKVIQGMIASHQAVTKVNA